jgi:RHS repeat-associated protein
VLAAYRYDAFGNLVAQATQPGGFVSPVGYRGERLDPVLAEYYLRARLYDPRTGRFTSMDEFAGNIVDPLTLHEFLYGDADPVNRSDPSGYFSVSQTLSVQGITNQPNFGLRLVTSALKVYQRVQDLLTLLQFAQKIVRFIKILGEPTVAGMAAALAAAIRSEIGSEEAAVLQGLRQALGTLTPHWKDISKAIRKAIPGIASELSARVAFRIPKYVALQQAGRLKAVFYAPTAPGPRGNEYYIDVGSAA